MSHPSLSRWLLIGEWRAHPVRLLVALVAIALGVALGFSIHLINATAFNEFSAAARSISGQADLQVQSAQGTLTENLYPQLAQRAGVALASPVLEVDAAPVLSQEKAVEQRRGTLKIIGLDVFRAASITPDLVGISAEKLSLDALSDDGIFLSPAAMEWLEVSAGDQIHLRRSEGEVRLRVLGSIARARPGQRIGVMDIATAQWRFGLLGQLSRIDLQLESGINRIQFSRTLQKDFKRQQLPLVVSEAGDQEQRTADLSRAYRVNLNVLALVALFTGAFLVFSTQALSIIRRRPQLALLRVLGWSRRQLLRQVLVEGAMLGVLGSLLGLALGYGTAVLALRFFGGDLGGGYFPGVQPQVQFAPLAALVFFCAGLATALLGSAAPAWQAARAQLAPALKSGSEDSALAALASPWPGLGCIVAGVGLTQLPPVLNLPLFGYLAIGLLLIGSIALMPRVAALVFTGLSKLADRSRLAVPRLALARLANAPNQAAIALGGILASFSLMVAMAIMVNSFRVSVDDWLQHLLPADLYLQSAPGDTALLTPTQQATITATPGVVRADFTRILSLTLAPAKPDVALLARTINLSDPGQALPLAGRTLAPDELPPGLIPVWASEAMVDLYGYEVGQRITLPRLNKMMDGSGEVQHFIVAGIWRDYARQTGALMIRLEDYQRLSGDQQVNDAALWLQPDANTDSVVNTLRQQPFGTTLEFSEPGEIRARSLRIFDRSFIVTYLLEAVAVAIGLFGIAATFSAQTLARAREFGMLRHLGLTRRQILGLLAIEGSLLSGIGIVAGFALGAAISLILIFIVNPQSFHWTMQLHFPWRLLSGVALALLIAAALTALVSGRHAAARSAVQAVKEDW